MTFLQALTNMVLLVSPVVVYSVVAKLRWGLTFEEISSRLGIPLRSSGKSYAWACSLALPLALIAIIISPRTSQLDGSMLAPYVGVDPTVVTVFSALAYGLLSTGFPEELLFRGAIAGALFRRLSFRKANMLQAAIFLVPHLPLLLVAPELWPLTVGLPLAIGLAAGWLRHGSESIWPGVLLHAVPNVVGAISVMRWSPPWL